MSLLDILKRQSWKSLEDECPAQYGLLPLLKFIQIKLQNRCDKTLVLFLEMVSDSTHDDPELLYIYKQSLRRQIEEAESQEEHLLAYFSSQGGTEYSLKSILYQGIRTSNRRVIREARRVDKEINDYVQLEVGRGARRDSRELRKMSSLQIQETKRGQSCLLFAIYHTINSIPVKIGMDDTECE